MTTSLSFTRHSIESAVRTLVNSNPPTSYNIYINPETGEFEARTFDSSAPDDPWEFVREERNDWLESAGVDPNTATDQDVDYAIEYYLSDCAADIIDQWTESWARQD